ncbi:ubiquitin-protein transferase activating protein [Modicella reniformis]|uniref:Ubiquitin-protein transferase activating protein n=1 Tax=Modicella reniformis TaxID=1440133 RepID=A0A9P6M215_9FUNG|nr:ubiquitin-protein transferase activating protein [Modicella reniformis]
MSASSVSPSKRSGAVSAEAGGTAAGVGTDSAKGTNSGAGSSSTLSKESARYAKHLKALTKGSSTLRGGRGGGGLSSRFSASATAAVGAPAGMEKLSGPNNTTSSTPTPITSSARSNPSVNAASSSNNNSSEFIRNKGLFPSLAASSPKSILGKRTYSLSSIAPETPAAASPFLALPSPSPIPRLGPKTPTISSKMPLSLVATTFNTAAIQGSSSSSPTRHPKKGQVGNGVPPKSMMEQAASSLTKAIGSGGLTTKLDVVANDWVNTGGSPKKTRKVYSQCDRFIPNRSATNMMSLQAKLDPIHRPALGAAEPTDEAGIAYEQQIAEACGIDLDNRMLAFAAEPPALDGRGSSGMRKLYSRHPSFTRSTSNLALKRRTIVQSPEKVLDAPGLKDDYYLNLLDWSWSNLLAIGLDRTVFIWDAELGHVLSLMTLPSNTDGIASVSWAFEGSFLAVGTFDGDTQIWDVETKTKLRSMTGHDARVGVLSWDKHILSSGCRDGSIWNHDVRIQNHKVAELLNHTNEVCGLAWRSDGMQLASGGNDNVVNIWDARSTTPKYTKSDHRAAVKAVAWCPWHNSLLATGGGTYDKQIHFWNSTTGARTNTLDTRSQVTSILFSTEYREFASTHGFPDNNITVYGYPSLTKVVDISAHDARILHTAISPDGQTVATVSSDENLKFWKLFEKEKKKEGKGQRLRKSGSFGGFGGRGASGNGDDGGRNDSGISGGIGGTTIQGKTIASMISIR